MSGPGRFQASAAIAPTPFNSTVRVGQDDDENLGLAVSLLPRPSPIERNGATRPWAGSGSWLMSASKRLAVPSRWFPASAIQIKTGAYRLFGE